MHRLEADHFLLLQFVRGIHLTGCPAMPPSQHATTTTSPKRVDVQSPPWEPAADRCGAPFSKAVSDLCNGPSAIPRLGNHEYTSRYMDGQLRSSRCLSSRNYAMEGLCHSNVGRQHGLWQTFSTRHAPNGRLPDSLHCSGFPSSPSANFVAAWSLTFLSLQTIPPRPE